MRLLLFVSVGLILAIWFILRVALKNRTVYVAGNFGFTSFNHRRPSVHQATEEQLADVISHLLAGDQFDMLWVSHEDDEYNGLLLTLEDGVLDLSVSFKTSSQQPEIEGFRKVLEEAGYEAKVSSTGFNGGFGEEFRETDFEISLPKNVEAVIEALSTALNQLQPGKDDGYFVSGSRLSGGPVGRKGIVIEKPSDPLQGIL